YDATLIVPCESIDAYKKHEIWGKFKKIECRSLSYKTDLPNVTITDGDELPSINLLDYFAKGDNEEFSFIVESSDKQVVYPAVLGEKLEFVQYGTGTTTITVTATVEPISMSRAFTFTINSKPNQPEKTCNLSISSEITNATCNSVANGKIEISVSGGAEPYQYKWTTGRTSSGIYNVRAGSYSVLVVDSLGCTATETFFVSEPSAVAVYEEITNPACGQNNGSISLRVFGGTEPYLYAWEGSTQTTSTIENLSADNYTVTVTDGNYCTVTKTFSLTEIGAPIVASPIVTPSKCNEPLGSVQIAVSGGTGEQTFEWNDSTKVANNLFRPRMYAGDYKLKVTDGNNCHATMYVTVPQIPFKQPEIALVSYGDTARHNLVVWQKENTNDIDYYNIYRETEYGNYEKIGTSAYKETSIFIDETADFKTKSSRYRLSASNKCWESPLSKEYKTILLQWKKNGNGSLDLWWDAYEGCEYVKYSILRLTRNGIDKFKDIPANKVRYTIDNVEEGTIGFFISVELISQVDVTKPMKSESGPFIIVVSNIAELENRDAVDDIAENQVLAFGGDKSIFVNNANGEDVIVCDLTGKTIVRKQNVDSTTIPVKTAGVYIVIVGDRAFKVVVRE
ncbi:MAG: SprB repeat-containing protein, partial [Bacteroidales bacterium]|nr:SprB repeat-containing protein [Bacteroidales bacterium]